MKRTWVLSAVWLTFSACASAWAQTPVPFYTSGDAVAGLYRAHTAPLARAFAESTPAMVQALQRHCAGPANIGPARQAWTRTVLAWEGLVAVAVGPVVERRSMRTIDFQPFRPDLLKRSLARNPQTLDDMVRVGTPAKGLPAIEHLLWSAPVAPSTAECSYAVLAALEVQREAQALGTAFDKLAAEPPEDEAGAAAFAEFVNQWLGGLERLRWASLEKPLREAQTRQTRPTYPRALSGQTVPAWRAHWDGLRALAIASSDAMPAPGTAAVPVETYLRGRGQNALADRWRAQVLAADAAMKTTESTDAARVEAAAAALKGVTALLQAEVGAALEVSIGFSSADGD